MVKPQATQNLAKIKREDERIFDQAKMQPGRMEIISLGMYEQGMPEPTLTLELKPNRALPHPDRVCSPTGWPGPLSVSSTRPTFPVPSNVGGVELTGRGSDTHRLPH